MISEKYKDFYVATASKQLKKLADLFISLEKETQNRDIIEDILRLIHSMKGASATMGYKKTVILLHSIEDVFSAAYRQELSVNQKIMDTFFDYLEVLQSNFKSIKNKGQEINLTKYSSFLNRFLKQVEKKSKGSRQGAGSKKSSMSYSWYTPTEITLSTYNLNTLHNLLDDLLINIMGAKGLAKEIGDTKILSSYMEIDRIVINLKRELEKMRIVSLSQIFSSLPYLVRDIANKEGKNVELVIRDNDLSLDKAIIDELVEIVIQLLTNAVVHGISSQQKDGRIIIEASLQNDQIQVEVSDNGRGIDWKKITEMAVAKKIITRSGLKKLSDSEIRNLIFTPRVSSDKNIGLSAGRGIGLSVVKQKVKELDGEVKFETSRNKGTKFIIDFPLPLSVFRSLCFHFGDFILALPLSCIDKIVKLKKVTDLSKDKFFTYQKSKYKLIPFFKFFMEKDFSALCKYVALMKGDRQHDQWSLPIYSNIKESELVMKRTPQVLRGNKYIKGVAVSSKGQPVLVLDISKLA
ncbi:MAG: hypothetical protein COV55_00855 [Candidatus Komeilibacteria bacterium CG11_big_fil_rev_8_21_14_0_20_36_20]|uniref:histidine kinase n=1 Tax=Candidatus Komeilibacteria bacterium CG11_big_fil_rev_8_21_14_0_20_36_20 TaxID=1974477 RepID=A0A2H0NDI8_9BACT|nr:MAG: hypothetical protein COV55_00855 [Candidatus Komeilibacteria bacterium CG11_big_fil_rev_8_21_14_0_20_36_20]PIR81329.1 MAG: hypothetical protein COU21_03825 [Candidatus Komeilibacteria bacterium CG10_big_fil_rev_8_21_14_0_10_36_65]PJC54959.1 MAG: hypothetical protein CO027_04495 [Candidatus Komeilibacteria bacterium CG_4_9_14_0_2_um_filter_36_13]